MIDLADRTAPTLLSHYDSIEFAAGVAVSGDYALVAQRWFGVEIFDIFRSATSPSSFPPGDRD